MQTLNDYIWDKYEGSNLWFEDEVAEQWQQDRVHNVLVAKEYLAGKHQIKKREIEYHNSKPFKPSAIILNYAKMITEFQTQFLLRNKLTLSLDDMENLKVVKDIYNKGRYHLLDTKLANTMIKYGEVYEYIYLDHRNRLKVNCFLLKIPSLSIMIWGK